MAGLGSQELYRMVLDSLPVAVCAVDREGKVILWNDGAERVTGYLRQDVLGRLCTEAFLEHADTDNNPLAVNALPPLATMADDSCLTVPGSPRKNAGHSGGLHSRTVPLR